MCIKYLNSTCFDVDTDDDTLGLYIGRGAFVLLPYVLNHWLYHMEKVGKEDSPRLMNEIEHLIDTRINPIFVGEAGVSVSQEGCFQSLNSIAGKTNRMLHSVFAFSKKRKRDFNLDDCK